MRLAPLLALLVLLPTAGGAATLAEKRQAEADRLLAGRVAGAPRACVPLATGTRVVAYGPRTLIYGDFGPTIYRNEPRRACRGADRDAIIVSSPTSLSQACQGDIIRIVDRVSGFPVGQCTLGPFTPYARAKGEAGQPPL